MLVFGQRISGNQKPIFVISNEVIMENSHAIPKRVELLLKYLIEQLSVVIAIALHIERIAGVESSLNHRVDIGDLSD